MAASEWDMLQRRRDNGYDEQREGQSLVCLWVQGDISLSTWEYPKGSGFLSAVSYFSVGRRVHLFCEEAKDTAERAYRKKDTPDKGCASGKDTREGLW